MRIGSSLATLLAVLVFSCPLFVSAQTWAPVTGADELSALFSDTVQEATLKDGVIARARYNADGAGILEAWNDTFERKWEVRGDDRICILIDGEFVCVALERNLNDPDEYRATYVDTGEHAIVFRIVDGTALAAQVPARQQGGAAQPSADEVARKLANPTNPIMTIGNNFDYVIFDGELPGANDQSAFRYVFQTVFPYKLADNKGTVFLRPAIPVLFNEPVPNGAGGFDEKGVELGEIGFDFSYGDTTANGLIYGGGLVGTLPTATDDALGKDQWALGPELLLGTIRKWGAIGGVLAHQWDVAGGDAGIETDLTTLNYFYAIFLKKGWQISAAPTIGYNHAATSSDDKLTLPLGIGISRTAILGGRPWKFQLQYWNYVERVDAFAAEHQIRISINPVVSAPWNEGR